MADETDHGDLLVTTFPSERELERAIAVLHSLGGPYRRIDPTPALSRVAVSALVLHPEVAARLANRSPAIISSGWVSHREGTRTMPEGPEPESPGACFERAAIMVLLPCVADETKIRVVAHLRGDLGPVFPFLNAVMQTAAYTPRAETLTFMDRHKMVALYRRRISIAKADDIVDAWLTLDEIRRSVEETWARRDGIEPSYEMRKKPPALEIFRRLPGTNCRLCGQLTCMAFAMRVWAGVAHLRQCLPLALPEQQARRAALLEISAGLGLDYE